MAYKIHYSDYAGGGGEAPTPPTPTPAPTGPGYRLRYSDYPGTAEGPPDPARWVGPPGPPGPAGPVGPAGPASTYILPTASTTILGGVKVDGSSITIASGVISSAAAAAAVTSWNTRTGAVTLTSADVTTALTFTPYNATNPAGYQTAAQVTTALTPYAPLASPTFTGTPTLPTSTIAVTQAPGTSNTTPATTAFVGAAVTAGTYTLPTASTTVLGGVKIDGTTVIIAAGVISSSAVASLGFTPYNATNPSGYQTAANVTTTLASPPAIGGTTPTTGKFTTVQSTIATGTAPLIVASTTNVANLNASSLNGATFAAPGAIGGTTAAAGAFTTLSATSTATLAAMTSTGITASPISGSTGSFTTLAASSTVSGAGFSTYLASPPAIGGTAAAAGKFAALTVTSGVNFGSTFAASATDLTKHIDLYGGTYGFDITSLQVNCVAPATAAHVFTYGGTGAGYINASGLNAVVGQQVPSPGTFTTLNASSGLHCGSTFASGAQDLSKHIDLNGGTYGICATAAAVIYNTPVGAAHNVYVGTGFVGQINSTGINFFPIGAGNPSTGAFTTLNSSGQTELIRTSGDVIVGRQTNNATTATSGFLIIPYCIAVPTGVPANNTKGIAMQYDTSTNKLMAYVGGAWRGVLLS